jgi:hypothetical protein
LEQANRGERCMFNIGYDNLEIALYGFISIAAISGLGCFICYIVLSMLERSLKYRRVSVASSTRISGRVSNQDPE